MERRTVFDSNKGDRVARKILPDGTVDFKQPAKEFTEAFQFAVHRATLTGKRQFLARRAKGNKWWLVISQEN